MKKIYSENLKKMKRILTLFISIASITIAFGQKLELKKASPFTAVKWESEKPIVQFNNDWYHFEKLDNLSKDEILTYCKKQYGYKWKKRFSEDLVEVLKGLNYIPNIQVDLLLSKDGKSKTYTGKFTLENRQKCLLYNKSNKVSKSDRPSSKQVKTISRAQAIEDLKQFKDILDDKSAYAQLSNYNYTNAIKELGANILNRKGDIHVDEFVNELQKIMSEFGDRHSSIKNESFDKKAIANYNLRLPFGIVVLNNNLTAIKQTSSKDKYQYYKDGYPYIKSINGIAIETLLANYNHRAKKAPKAAKLTRGAYAIERFGALLFKNNKQIPKIVEVVLTDGKKNMTLEVNLTTEKLGYASNIEKENFKAVLSAIKEKKFNSWAKLLESNIGYIKIPQMFHLQDIEGLEDFIKTKLQEFSSTKSLIIDLRGNLGGGRGILKVFANYLVQPEQSPWVANVAYLRTNKPITSDEGSMSGRFLYSYNSQQLTSIDRKAIDTFNKGFKIEKSFDKSKFSSPFYMVLHSGNKVYTKPVYILVNENSFSAATVFTSAFKGLPNVRIVGVTTDGSSGNSRKIYLNNSNIRVKVSTMLSFQRNGKTLDGNGTKPDIYLQVDTDQVFAGKDTQLEKLVEILNKEN